MSGRLPRWKNAGEGAYGEESEAEEAAGSRPQKRGRTKAPKPKKAYVPGYRTAGDAFMIALFKAKAGGQDYMLKEELIQAAEDSQIAHKPIRGDSCQIPVKMHFSRRSM